MKVGEYIKELEKYNPSLIIKKSLPTRDDCFLLNPIKPKIIMVDDWHDRETDSGTLISYSYEKKPILVI